MRLQESMLLVPAATRASFWTMKFISLVDFEHEKNPIAWPPCVSRMARKPSAARPSASCQPAGLSSPLSRTRGCVSLLYGT